MELNDSLLFWISRKIEVRSKVTSNFYPLAKGLKGFMLVFVFKINQWLWMIDIQFFNIV